jgi:hypothetical protein
MDLLIALGIGGVAAITVMTVACALTGDPGTSEEGFDASEDWFFVEYVTEQEAMWIGPALAEVELPPRPDVEAA